MTIEQIECDVCGELFDYTRGRGRRPKRCPKHRSGKNRAASLRRRAATGDSEAEGELARLGYALPAPAEANRLSAVQRLAIGLRISPELEGAASAVGLEQAEAELLVDDARAEATKLAKPDGIAEIGWQALGLLLLRLRDTASTLPANQVGASMKQLWQVLEGMQGGAAPMYGEFKVSLAAPDLAEVEEWRRKVTQHETTEEDLDQLLSETW